MSMFCGLPVMVAVPPMLEAMASAKRKGTGFRPLARQWAMRRGVSTSTTASLTRKALATPVNATTTTSNCRADWARPRNSSARASVYPSCCSPAMMIIMPSSSAMVSQSMADTASRGVKTPNSTMATAPPNADAGRSTRTQGRRSTATPTRVIAKIASAVAEVVKGAIPSNGVPHYATSRPAVVC